MRNRARPSGPPVLGMVLKGYPRISETFISNEIRLLEEMGFSIHIFSMRKPREAFSHASVKSIKAGVTYLPESLFFGLPALLMAAVPQFAVHPRRFLRCARLWFSRFAMAPKKHTWIKHFLQGGYLARKARAKNIPVAHLHAHFAHTPSTVAMYGAILLDVPFSFTAHAKDIYTQARERVADKVVRASFAVTCTGYNQAYLRQISQGSEVECVYHGIDLSLFFMNGGPRLSEPPYTVMTVARFVSKKGLETVFQALAMLRERGLDLRYVLVGDGKRGYRKHLEVELRRLGLEDVTTLTGTIPHEEVLDIYRGADLFVLGCRVAEDGDRDGIPNVVAEAMAMGVPVAATDVSGLPELVEQGVSGLLCPSLDPGALADIMERLLTDQDLRKQVIPAARERVEEVFDNRKLIRDLGRIYAERTDAGPGAEAG